jgi:hypothetical protein
LTLLSVASNAIHILELSLFLINWQEKIDTVTVGGVENVEEEDCITIKTEEDYTQFARVIKTEQEVSVLCLCILWYVIYLQVCVQVSCTLYLVTHTFHTCVSNLFIFCMWISMMYLCDMLRLIVLYVHIVTYFLSHTPHHQVPSCLVQSVLICV